MNREQKSSYVSSLKESLNNNEAMMIYHYHGLNVNQLDDLRNQMREAGALLKVTKNRITKIALKDTQHEEAISLFSGQTGVALSKDPITLAKTLVNFQKKNDMLKIVGGVMDSKVLAPEDVAKIATLPTLDEARAKIAAILQTPAQQLISILLAPGAKIANLAHAKSLKKD
ncbi:LSU ribosomal protein L10P [Candidatus Pelagibacter sp. IMCC9063]|jgi:large subunit ribosomal protein L10|uniref:50S ribosomal protein L10 n=1 Tax=Pelagibacter sp. (strain IMCC9063) TaxID=1002672 RepID=UPI000204637B|nr:50S ribosomal protein L10 [Candidatus Pelagibacter sp. IMCC9063]AEA81708.1 LSU ribosomal protein L10P [Candidatus Pelagibacter sp. IMCC9063]|tara:strand:- start:40 stop:552 length:513 start_codon:yes stop_codon:yes gene_type:complete